MTLTLEVPEKFMKKLVGKADELGLTAEELTINALADYLGLTDPITRSEIHLELCEKYLHGSEPLLGKGDYTQASEKLWGAAAQMVKAVAARRDRTLDTHAKLWGFIGELVKETKDEEIADLWSSANALHKNFYEVQLPSELVELYGTRVKKLIEKLKKLLEMQV